MDILALLDDKGVQYTTKSGDEISIVCPNQSAHKGGSDDNPSFFINLQKHKGHCFVCDFKLNEVGMHKWLLGEDLDEFSISGLRIRAALKRLHEAEEELLPPDEEEFFWPHGETWDVDGYRGISLTTYHELGAIRVTRGRYQNRICFPVRVKGKLIGIDARALGDEVPKYLRNKNSTCKTNWLFPYDVVVRQQPKLLLIGEGLFHAVNGYDKGFPTLCYFGVKNWSLNKIFMCLATGAEEVCYFPDPDKAGFEAAVRITASLSGLFNVSVADTSNLPDGKDLGDLTREQITEAVDNRKRVKIAECLKTNWEHKIVHDQRCTSSRCPYWNRGRCGNPVFEPE